MNWVSCDYIYPDVGNVVWTKDANGFEQKLVRSGNMWWLPDMSKFMWHRPTHWLNTGIEIKDNRNEKILKKIWH